MKISDFDKSMILVDVNHKFQTIWFVSLHSSDMCERFIDFFGIMNERD